MTKFLTNRWIHFLLLFAVLFGFVFGVGVDSPLRQRIQMVVFDHFFVNNPRESSGHVTIVDFDDASLTKVGQWPWPRTQIAKIIENLHAMGANVVAFDGVLAEADRTSPSKIVHYVPEDVARTLEGQGLKLQDNDAVLAETIKETGNFVGAFSHGSNPDKPRIISQILSKKDVKAHFLQKAQRFETSAKFLPILEKNLAGNGSFMAKSEIDNVIRRTSLIFTDRKLLYPSLIVEALRVGHGDKRPIVKLGTNKMFSERQVDTEHRLMIGAYEVPIDSRGKIWVHFRKWDKERDYVPAFDALSLERLEPYKDRIAGKVILIGSSAEGLLDLRSTPQGLIPGVEIHANAVEQIIDNHYLIRPQIVKDAENNFILVVGLLTILLAPFLGVVWMALLTISTVGGAFTLSVMAFMDHGILIDPVYPALAAISIFMLSSILTYIRTEADRKRVKEAFGLYISPDFMQELTKDPDKLSLGGEVKELSVMFTDIRSFTTISESLTPEELIQLMNEFLTPMSDLVMRNRGTIDKYMGDAMMAFWNAPLDDDNHARNACYTALSMNEALGPINDELAIKAEKEGKDPLILQAGIGINTGPCSVGNMGSKQRFAYSALGDAVNLASRLEGQTKNYGVRVLGGEETWRQAADLAWLEMDLIRVKGKIEPVRIFALLGKEDMAKDEDFQHWQASHNGLLAAYRAADFDCAAQDLAEAQKAYQAFQDKQEKVFQEDLTVFYDLYDERIKDMFANPPGSDWDGVFTATSK